MTKIGAKFLYTSLILVWVYLMHHYWAWLRDNPFMDLTYLVAETWMLWCFTMFTVVILVMIKDIRKGS